MRALKLYSTDTILDFGKYRGIELKDVLTSHPSYLKWCVDTIEWFLVESETLEEIFQNLSIIKLINHDFVEVNDYLPDEVKEVTRSNNSKKWSTYYEIGEQKMINANYNCDDYYEDWARDMKSNWLAYAAGSDDPEVMNDVYWNLD